MLHRQDGDKHEATKRAKAEKAEKLRRTLTEYDPLYLDDPDKKCEKRRKLLCLTSYRTSIAQQTVPPLHGRSGTCASPSRTRAASRLRCKTVRPPTINFWIKDKELCPAPTSCFSKDTVKRFLAGFISE